MKNLILVPMKRNDRPEDFVPYIAEVARSGMKAVFLVPYPVDGYRWSNAEGGLKAIQDGQRLASYYTWDSNLKKARELVRSVGETLSANGIEVEAELYAGDVRRAIHSFAAKDEIHLIVSRTSLGNWIERMLDAATSLVRSLGRPGFTPVIMINPRTLM